MTDYSKSREWANELEKRILRWVVAVLKFIDTIPKTTANTSVSRQLADSSGSTGANYVEGRSGRSKKEFASSMGIAAKECKESLFWLRVFQELKVGDIQTLENLLKEGNEIASILASICIRSKENNK